MSNQPQTPVHAYLSRVVDAAVLAPDLSGTEAAHLPYVYATTVDGPLAVAVLQDVRRLGLFAKWAGDFVATDKEIPAPQVAEWLLLPSSPMAREAIQLYLCGVTTDGAVIEADPFLVGLGLDNIHPVADEEAAFEQKLGNQLAIVELLQRVLQLLGIDEHIMIEPITADSIIIGNRMRLTPTASGWKVAALDLGA